jgi:hypothetical protein
MVIEYIGEVIRTELSELREKLYEARVSILLELFSALCNAQYINLSQYALNCLAEQVRM